MDLTFRGHNATIRGAVSTKRQENTTDFLAAHPVFTLDQAASAFRSRPGSRAVAKRLRRYVEDGRLKVVERGLYAVVPPRHPPETFQPDPFLTARAARPDAVFCCHIRCRHTPASGCDDC